MPKVDRLTRRKFNIGAKRDMQAVRIATSLREMGITKPRELANLREIFLPQKRLNGSRLADVGPSHAKKGNRAEKRRSIRRAFVPKPRTR